eukprot:710130-Pyramimonas_sp.AAC.1
MVLPVGRSRSGQPASNFSLGHWARLVRFGVGPSRVACVPAPFDRAASSVASVASSSSYPHRTSPPGPAAENRAASECAASGGIGAEARSNR